LGGKAGGQGEGSAEQEGANQSHVFIFSYERKTLQEIVGFFILHLRPPVLQKQNIVWQMFLMYHLYQKLVPLVPNVPLVPEQP
jgi:hypothetical protein